MAYFEGETADFDYRILLSGMPGHKPKLADFPKRTDVLVVEVSTTGDETWVHKILTGEANLEEGEKSFDGKPTDIDPLEDLRKFAKDQQIPLIAPDPLMNERGGKIIHREIEASFRVSPLNAAKIITQQMLARLDSPGEVSPNSIRGRAFSGYTHQIEQHIPYAGFANLVYAQKSLAYLQDPEIPINERPHVTLAIGASHFGLRHTIAMLPAERLKRIQEHKGVIEERYVVPKFHIGFGAHYNLETDSWRTFNYSDPALKRILS